MAFHLREAECARVVSDMLNERHPDLVIEELRVLERVACGGGKASTADQLRLRLRCAGSTSTLPPTLLLKMRLLHPAFRFQTLGIVTLSRALSIADRTKVVGPYARRGLLALLGEVQRRFPQAPDTMYATEARFYAELRETLDLETPHSYGSVSDPSTRRFGVLMEDLRTRHAQFQNVQQRRSMVQVQQLLLTLARLHARFWTSSRFATDLAWIPTRVRGGMFPIFDGIGRELVRYQVEAHPFKAELLAPLRRSVDELWSSLWLSQRALDREPHTLLHGDAQVGNTYQLPDGTCGLLDWQLLVRGHWANDVSYLIATALDTQQRRAHERALLHFYLETLAQYGVTVPARDQAFDHYRKAMLWGLVIGWLITPPTNYGEAITRENLSRLSAAAYDLSSVQAAHED